MYHTFISIPAYLLLSRLQPQECCLLGFCLKMHETKHYRLLLVLLPSDSILEQQAGVTSHRTSVKRQNTKYPLGVRQRQLLSALSMPVSWAGGEIPPPFVVIVLLQLCGRLLGETSLLLLALSSLLPIARHTVWGWGSVGGLLVLFYFCLLLSRESVVVSDHLNIFHFCYYVFQHWSRRCFFSLLL